MLRLVASGLALALCVGTAGLIANNSKPEVGEVQLAADGAFRDGLYLGRLAAQSGQPERPLVGRWSSKQDRASFAAGYSRGYRELASKSVASKARVE